MKKLIILMIGIATGHLVRGQILPIQKVEHYSLKDGLSYGVINGITQDDKGFMWFATGDGLNRFDGKTFKVFKYEPNRPNCLPGNFVQTLFKDHLGKFWLSSRMGVYNFDPVSEKFTRFSPLTQNQPFNVTSISESKGLLWFGRSTSGFSSYNCKQKLLTNYTSVNLPGLPYKAVQTVFQDSFGLVWVALEDGTVRIFNTDNRHGLSLSAITSKATLLPKSIINSIYEDHYHDIWLATVNSLIVYSRTGNLLRRFILNPHQTRSNYFYSLLEGADGRLLVGLQDGGLYSIDLQKTRNEKFASLSIEPVRSDRCKGLTVRTVQILYRDQDNNIWAGTYGDGIYMLSHEPPRFKNTKGLLVDSDGTSLVRFYGMCLGEKGDVWLGSDGDGIFQKNAAGKIINHYRASGKKGALTDNAILYAFKDRSADLWFGSYAHGLFRFDKKTNSFDNFIHNEADKNSIAGNDVRVIIDDSEKNLWVGMNGGGLSLMKKNSTSFINFNTHNSSIAADNIRALIEDHQGNIFIGTYGAGLCYYEPGLNKFSTCFNKAEVARFLPSQVIYSLFLDSDDILYIGSEGNGLICFNTRTHIFTHYTEHEGLADNTINAIQKDETGNLWLSTNRGISKINPRLKTVKNYDTSDGLQSGQFNPGSSLYSAKDKYMVFGGTDGYDTFYPELIKEDFDKPRVVITGLQVYGKEIDPSQQSDPEGQVPDETKQIVLEPNQSVFSIQYQSLNYSNPAKSEFAYKMTGLDKSWNYVKSLKTVSYRNLPAGEYIFQVKATNHDGIWSDKLASLKLKVLPSWYETWWALLSYTIAGIGLIYWFLVNRINKARLAYEIKLAQISSVQENELNERKLSFFTNISHEFRTPLTLIINPVKELLAVNGLNESDLSGLQVVFRNAKRLLSLVDQLLLFRKAEAAADTLKIVKIDIVSLAKEVFLCFINQAREKDIEFKFDCTLIELEIYADREKIEIVLFNLISNALKFTPDKGSVSIVVVETSSHVRIRIKDSGCGIRPGLGNKVFNKFFQVNDQLMQRGGFGIGLFLVKNFIDSHAGKISYHSHEGKGTVFKISLLKGREHIGQHLIFEDIGEKSVFLQELVDQDYKNMPEAQPQALNPKNISLLKEDRQVMVIVEDNAEIRNYLRKIFTDEFEIIEALNGWEGLKIIHNVLPDIIISDVLMPGLSGIELCRKIKEDISVSYIPLILLTASSSPENRLKGLEGGADDYISKPFEKDILKARVTGLMKNRSSLQNYFYNEITLKSNDLKIAAEYKTFLNECIVVVESHLEQADFCIKILADKMGISHSNLYKKIRAISGQSASSFIRFIRLRKAAELFLNTSLTISETAYKVGINDPKYFREQFNKLFGINPSDYIKKFRPAFHMPQPKNQIKKIVNSAMH